MRRSARLPALVASLFVLMAGAALAQPSTSPTSPYFTDITEGSGLEFQHFNGMSGRLYYLEVVGSGGALFDFDNDGDLDVYLVQSKMLGADRTPAEATFPWTGPSPPMDRLFRNDLEGGRLSFTDVTEESGIRAMGYGIGVATGDFDNDGWIDLYLPQHGANELWRNRGDGSFENVTRKAGVGTDRWSSSASWTDFDRDGDLDLFVVNYLEYNLITHKTCLTERGEPDYCLPSAYQPVADTLYVNNGDGTFTDVTTRLGVGRAANGLGAVAADFNADGRCDIYVANDLMDNHLWLQQADGTFVEDAVLAGVAVNRDGRPEASMGVAAADSDNDGDLDLFMTHFRRESNTFYRSQGDGFFDDETAKVHLDAASWNYTAFGTGFLDYDNDGWLDLVTANGAVTFPAGGDRSRNSYPLDEINQLFRGSAEGFSETTLDAGAAFAQSDVSRGALLGDLDNDGDTDLIFTNNSGTARLLRNEIGSKKRWLGIEAILGNRTDHGALVEVTVGQQKYLRRSHTDGGYASANDPRILLGAPGNEPIRAIEVTWSDGAREHFVPSSLTFRRVRKLIKGTGFKNTQEDQQ